MINFYGNSKRQLAACSTYAAPIFEACRVSTGQDPGRRAKLRKYFTLLTVVVTNSIDSDISVLFDVEVFQYL